MSGIIFVVSNGPRWRDAPAEYGPPRTIYNRFIWWSRPDVFNKSLGPVRNFVREAMMMRRRIIAWQLRKNFWTGCSWAATRTRYFRETACSTI
jgi:transposase